MRPIANLIVFFSLMIIACSSNNKIEKWKAEIIQTEKDFADMASREGIPAAFEAFAAENVVILRNDSLIKDKEGLIHFFKTRDTGKDSISLTWEPDFADVSLSGDLGYTYGSYRYSVTDSAGVARSHEGVFHTVWKRQKDGNWKFVWD